MDMTVSSQEESREHAKLSGSFLNTLKEEGRRTGRGKALTMARFTLTMAANCSREAASLRATSAPAATIASGPDTASEVCEKFVTICNSPAHQACHCHDFKKLPTLHMLWHVQGVHAA